MNEEQQSLAYQLSLKLSTIDTVTRNFIKKSMKEVVIAGLGLANDWSRGYEAQVTNNFTNKLIELIRDIAQNTIQFDALKEVTRLFQDDKFVVNFQEVVVEAYRKHYCEQFHAAIARLTKEHEEKIKQNMKDDMALFLKNIDVVCGPVIKAIKSNQEVISDDDD